jgi:aarF domain-containing kinase
VYLLAGAAFADYQSVKMQTQSLDEDERDRAYERCHERTAALMRDGATSLGGLWIKVAQYVSSRPDIVPQAYCLALRGLQDGAPRSSWADVEAELKAGLGAEWRTLFRSVDEQPISSASIAQVHPAVFHDDTRVALKVRHPNVRSIMEQDMENLRILTDVLFRFEPEQDYRGIIREWLPAARQELDLRIEARNLEEVNRNLERANVRAIIPEAVRGLVAENVLGMTFCEGFRITDTEKLDASGVDRSLLVRRVCSAFAAQIHSDGFYNADPHPGNLLVSTDPGVNGGDASVPILLDFGLVKRFCPDMRLAFARMVYSSNVMDVDALLQSFNEMGLKIGGQADPFQDLANVRRMFKTVKSSEAKEAKEKWARERKERENEAPRLKRPIEAWPNEFVFFFRVNGLLRGLCSALEVDIPYLDVMADKAKDALKEAVPREQWAQNTLFLGEQEGRPDGALQGTLGGVLERACESERAVGIQCAVFRHGQLEANVAAGTLGEANPLPVDDRTLFNVFSVTKGIVASLVHSLCEGGLLDYDESVAKYWPEFGCNGKEDILLSDVLNHQAGLANAFPPSASIEDLLSPDNMIRFLAEAPPEFPSSENRFQYHYLTFGWLLDGVIRGLGQKYTLNSVLDDVLQQMGLQGQIHIGIPSSTAGENLAVLSFKMSNVLPSAAAGATGRSNGGDGGRNGGSDPRAGQWERFKGVSHLLNPTTFNMRRVREASIPSANGHASALALARFYAGLFPREEAGDALLSWTTYERCLAHELAPERAAVGSNADLQFSTGTGTALGFQVFYFRRADGTVVKGLGHGGFGGSLGLTIPEEGLAIAVTVNDLHASRAKRPTSDILAAVAAHYGLEQVI